MATPGTRSGSHAVTLAIGLLVGLLGATLLGNDDSTPTVSARSAAGAQSALPGGASTAAPLDGAAALAGGAPSAPTGATAVTAVARPGGQAAARGPGGAGAGAASGGPVAITARGVSNTSVRVGVSYPDLAALGAFPEYDQGNVEAQWKAALQRLRDERVLPAHGRDVELVFRKASVFIAEEERAACVGLIDDDKSFLVIGMVAFNTGRDCVTREKKTVLVTADGPPDDAFARDMPYLFSLGLSESAYLRNGITWAHQRGMLRGKNIGLFYFKGDYVGPMIEASVKQTLAQLGYKPVEEITTDQATANQPDIAVAVQRMKTAGVNHALIYVDAISRQEFYRQAQAQGFKPTYQADDWGFGTSDSTNQRNEPEQFDGTFAVTTRRVGETRGGGKPDASQTKCLEYYEQLSGRKPTLESNEYAYTLLACDEAEVVARGLQNAGQALDTAAMIRGIEAVQNFLGRRYALMSFGPARHFGSIQQRPLQWSRSCTCWAAKGPFEPLSIGV